MKTLSLKHHLNKTKLLEKYGMNIEHKHVRKDGKLIKIDFKRPTLNRNVLSFKDTMTADPISFTE